MNSPVQSTQEVRKQEINTLAAALKRAMLGRVADWRTGASALWGRYQSFVENKKDWLAIECHSKEVIEDNLSGNKGEALTFLKQAHENVLFILKDNPRRAEVKKVPYDIFCKDFVLHCASRYGLKVDDQYIEGITCEEFLQLELVKKETYNYGMAYHWTELIDWLKEKIYKYENLPDIVKSVPAKLDSDNSGSQNIEKKLTFSDLFINPSDINPCIDALRQIRTERPVIDITGQWIGGRKDGSKAILVAWIERLEFCRKIRKLDNRKELVCLLNKHFTNLNMGAVARIFDEPTDEDARLAFSALIPK